MRCSPAHLRSFRPALLLVTALAAALGPAMAHADEPPAAAKPVLVPPKLLQFVEAKYPEEAEKAGIEANVVLRLDIDATGHVVDAVVQETAGHGFDEAATEAAKQFVFEPATRDGKPIPSRILYRYGFTLKPKEPETKPGETAPEKPAAPTTGTLAGSVKIAGGDDPLGGAHVVVTDAKGKVLDAIVGLDGTWSAKDLPPGRYRVTVDAPGFRTVALD